MKDNVKLFLKNSWKAIQDIINVAVGIGIYYFGLLMCCVFLKDFVSDITFKHLASILILLSVLIGLCMTIIQKRKNKSDNQ